MSYAVSAALQAAVYRRLSDDPTLAALVGGEIYDAPLELARGQAAPDHITLGEDLARPFDTATSRGVVHDFGVSAHSGRDGFEAVKRIAGAVCESLVDAPLEISGGHLVALRFLRAKAERGPAPEKRKVTLRFRAVIDLDTHSNP